MCPNCAHQYCAKCTLELEPHWGNMTCCQCRQTYDAERQIMTQAFALQNRKDTTH